MIKEPDRNPEADKPAVMINSIINFEMILLTRSNSTKATL